MMMQNDDMIAREEFGFWRRGRFTITFLGTQNEGQNVGVNVEKGGRNNLFLLPKMI